ASLPCRSGGLLPYGLSWRVLSATTEAVLKIITSMGLDTRKGRPITRQTFHKMIQNPFYCGWIVSGETRVKGSHAPLISEELFQAVQSKLNGKSTPHKKLNEDFPLRGFIRCYKCNKPLTAGWAKGRNERYARYWCWTKGCGAVARSKEILENHFFILLTMLKPTAYLLSKIPELAARSWEDRKSRIAADAKVLSNRLAEQNTLNQKAIVAKLNGTLSEDDFQSMKKSVNEENLSIESDIKTLDSERPSMEDLISQTQNQVIDFESERLGLDRKSTRLNSSHVAISYAVFCLKKKKNNPNNASPGTIQIHCICIFREKSATTLRSYVRLMRNLIHDNTLVTETSAKLCRY